MVNVKRFLTGLKGFDQLTHTSTHRWRLTHNAKHLGAISVLLKGPSRCEQERPWIKTMTSKNKALYFLDGFICRRQTIWVGLYISVCYSYSSLMSNHDHDLLHICRGRPHEGFCWIWCKQEPSNWPLSRSLAECGATDIHIDYTIEHKKFPLRIGMFK